MKLGIFDSGLGGLLIAKSIRNRMPDIDMIYLGDTLHVPYGSRSNEAIYDFCRRAVEFLFSKDCNLIVIACNTASASALRRLQQEYLPEHYSERRLLGVVVPTLEEAVEQGAKNIGLIGTNYIIQSNIYEDELQKIDPEIKIIQQATPLLVPLIEHEGTKWAQEVLNDYLEPLKKQSIESLILGCTHYPFLKSTIQDIVGPDITLLSQDEIIPGKLEEYFQRHPEISEPIGRNASAEFYVSDITDSYQAAANSIYGEAISIQKTEL